MIPNMATIGVRFDIEKVGGGYYGCVCWKILWQAINPEEIGVASLYEGDTAATLNGRENVFCIAVQSLDSGAIGKVKAALSRSEAFKRVCANSMFAEGSSCAAEPLPDAGRIDAGGNLVGDAGASRSALGSVRKERQPTSAPTKTRMPERRKPASNRTRDLPTVSSFDDLEELFERKFTSKNIDYTYWVTPEELCDIVERYADMLEVQFSEYSCGRSEDLACVQLFQKNPPEGHPIEFIGMFAFPSQSEAMDFWKEINRDDPRLAEIVPGLANIQGKWHLNFKNSYGNPRDITYEKEIEIPPATLWEKVCARRQRLGVPEPTVGGHK